MMNFLNLKYFLRVAEEGNITRVAEQEHISQQSLSNHIRKIESEYGVELFDRTGGISLTYAGEQFYNYAVRLLSIHNDMENEIFDMTDSEQGTLRIGISYTRGSSFLPEILPSFCRENPFIKISIVENHSQMPEKYLLHGQIDLYVGTDMRSHPDIEHVYLTDEKLYLIVPNKIADKVKLKNDLKAYKNEPFLLLAKGNRIRDMFDEAVRSEGVNVKVRLEAENIETLFELACRGMGITAYSEMFLRRHRDVIESESSPVEIIPLDNIHENILSIGYNRKKYLSNAAKSFIDKACEICGKGHANLRSAGK